MAESRGWDLRSSSSKGDMIESLVGFTDDAKSWWVGGFRPWDSMNLRLVYGFRIGSTSSGEFGFILFSCLAGGCFVDVSLLFAFLSLLYGLRCFGLVWLFSLFLFCLANSLMRLSWVFREFSDFVVFFLMVSLLRRQMLGAFSCVLHVCLVLFLFYSASIFVCCCLGTLFAGMFIVSIVPGSMSFLRWSLFLSPSYLLLLILSSFSRDVGCFGGFWGFCSYLIFLLIIFLISRRLFGGYRAVWVSCLLASSSSLALSGCVPIYFS